MSNYSQSHIKSSHLGHVAFFVLAFLLGSLVGYGVGKAYEEERGASGIFDQIFSSLGSKKHYSDTKNEIQSTFTDTLAGFTFDYPKSWNISHATASGANYIEIVSVDKKSDDTELANVSIFYYRTTEQYMKEVSSGTNVQSLDAYIASWIESNLFTNSEKTTIAGVPAWAGTDHGIVSNYIVIVEHKGGVYVIEFANAEVKSELTTDDNQMLGSFKFL